MWLQRERNDDVIWCDWKLGGHLELNAILFQSWSKRRSNPKLPSIIATNISRSSPHTTSWFTEVRHQHLKTTLQGLLSHVHILIVSKSNLKLQVFGLFSRLVRTLIIKKSSSEEPANSTSIHRVRNGGNIVLLFHPSPKNIAKRSRSPSWKPGEERSKYQRCRTRRTNFIGACADEMPLCWCKRGVTIEYLILSHKLRCYTGISGSEKSHNKTREKTSYFPTCVDIANQLTRHSPLAPLGVIGFHRASLKSLRVCKFTLLAFSIFVAS